MKHNFPRSTQSNAPIPMTQNGRPIQADVIRVGQTWEMDVDGRDKPLRFRIWLMRLTHGTNAVEVGRTNVGKPRKGDPILYKETKPLAWCEERALAGEWRLVKQSSAHPLPGVTVRNHLERLFIRDITLNYRNRAPINLLLEHPRYVPGYGGHADTIDLRDYHEQLALGQLFYDPQPDRNLASEEAYHARNVREGKKSLAKYAQLCTCGHSYELHFWNDDKCIYCFCDSFVAAGEGEVAEQDAALLEP